MTRLRPVLFFCVLSSVSAPLQVLGFLSNRPLHHLTNQSEATGHKYSSYNIQMSTLALEDPK